MSAGASAWAARALVPLQLDAEHPFWAAPDPGVGGVEGGGRRDAAGMRTDLVLRGPGFLVGREQGSGATWVASALLDHPDDIPGHDYRPSYGKWLYHSDFPFTERTASGSPGPDGALVLETPGGTVGHRALVDAGGVGPGWTWTRHRIATGAQAHAVSTVSVRIGDAWVRAIGLRPRGPVRATAATLPLGVDDPSAIVRTDDPALGTQAATDGRRWVAIRPFVGWDASVPSGPARGGTDRNLVAEHAEQPSVEEHRPSHRRRVLGHADMARTGGGDPMAEMAAIDVRHADSTTLLVTTPTGETCRLAAGARPPREVKVGGWTFRGPALHVIRVGPRGAWLGGESIVEVVGAVRFARPGPALVRRLTKGRILLGTTAGAAIDPGWARARPDRLLLLDGGAWIEVGRLEEALVISDRTFRTCRRRTGHRFVWLQVTP
jgi:hypothetical protein